jgi:hypothetical protein
MGKQFLPKTDFPFKSYDKKLVFLRRMGGFFPYRAQGKKTFIVQSVRSTFAKLFAHVLLVVYRKILQLKMKNIYIFSFGLLELEMAVFNGF